MGRKPCQLPCQFASVLPLYQVGHLRSFTPSSRRCAKGSSKSTYSLTRSKSRPWVTRPMPAPQSSAVENPGDLSCLRSHRVGWRRMHNAIVSSAINAIHCTYITHIVIIGLTSSFRFECSVYSNDILYKCQHDMADPAPIAIKVSSWNSCIGVCQKENKNLLLMVQL